MALSRWRLIIVLFCVCMITACGFRPLYENGNTLAGGSSRFDLIEIDDVKGASNITSTNAMNFVNNINSVNGHNLHNALVDRFYHNGYPQNPLYVLQITTSETRRDIVIERDDTKSRAQVVIVAYYKLIDKQTRAVVDQGNIRAASSYNILSSEYTTSVTREQARDMALTDLADKITLRMAVFLDGRTTQ